MLRLILPNTRVDPLDGPVIYLAGPIIGAPKWQGEAVAILHTLDPDLFVASPSTRLPEDQKRAQVKGNQPNFTDQLTWERYYMEMASKQGAILFWLPVEKQHDCNHPYARDTRGELGEWRGRLAYDKDLRVVIGREEGFDTHYVIQRNYQTVVPGIKFYSSLDETCTEATRLARQ
ncbi:MAG TPA: hypothetical protein VKK79_18300 [Candidatus Lokiarchaeia archaeon]|nr:hypothetical protein [Candidatus Lokiarchaeia archaeon]